MSRSQKVAIIVALITGISTIISAIIGNYIGKENAVNEVINQATNTINVDIGNIDDLIIAYSKMNDEISELKNNNEQLEKEKESLTSENNVLKGDPDQFSRLVEENSLLLEKNSQLNNQIVELNNQIVELNNQIVELNNQIQLINTTVDNQEKEIVNNPNVNINNVRKVSIFDLETFKGNGYWFNSSSKGYLTDTYDNEYLSIHYASHSPSINIEESPIYLLDKNFILCEGQIAWPKNEKNTDGSAWIEFYSGENCIYTTEAITADSRVLTFQFSVEGIEKLTIVRKATRGTKIIYPYLNLIR